MSAAITPLEPTPVAPTPAAPPAVNPLAGSAKMFTAALAIPLVYLLFGLDAVGLLNNHEGIYAEVAREMLESGEYLIPHLNGVPYIEKPPLLYYLLALSMAQMGSAELVLRLVPATAGLVTLVAVSWFARRHGCRGGAVLAPLVLGSSAGFLLMEGLVGPDMLLCALLTIALLSLCLALERHRRGYLYVSYAFLALASLVNGLVALALFGLVVVFYVLLARRKDWWVLLRFTMATPALLVFLLIAAPWHIAVAIQLPEFSWFHFVKERLLGFASLPLMEEFDVGTVAYLVPRLALFFLPWLLVLLPLLFRRRVPGTPRDGATIFLWVCIVVPLVFFALSQAKADRYVLLCLPFLALLTAFAVEAEVVDGKPNRLVISAAAFAAFAVALLLMRATSVEDGGAPPYLALTDRSVAIVLWLWLAIAVAAAALFIKQRLVGGLIVLALSCLPLKLAVTQQLAAMEDTLSARSAASHIATFHDSAAVFIFEDFEAISALPFYLRRTVGVIDSKSPSLEFGRQLVGKTSQFPSAARMLIGLEQPAIIVAHKGSMESLKKTLMFDRLAEARRFGEVSIFKLESTAQRR